MTHQNNPIALKEWAAAVKALREGKQILVLRKGGIIEETQEFQVESHEFFLYPTYEHQRKELIKEEYRQEVDETLTGWSPENSSVKLTAYAEVADDIEIIDQDALNLLRGFHIWTDRFAEERLKWKRQKPLHVLLLRVYELEQPVEIDILPQYTGCKSWIEIQDAIQDTAKRPVLSDEQFQKIRLSVKAALKR